MRNMSFSLTTAQVRAQMKTFTRRMGWRFAKAGDVVQPIVKGQGLKKGEKVERIGGPIRFTEVWRERLWWITKAEVVREGFPDMTPIDFIELFCKMNRCAHSDEITRIAFEYTEPVGEKP